MRADSKPPCRRVLAAPAAAATACSIAAMAAVLLGGCADTATAPEAVLLVTMASVRADHVSCHGYESATRPDLATTPNLDQLAAEGTRFARAVSTSSRTLPAHAALLTGLPNELHGARTTGDVIESSVELLAETFARAGWRTAGFYSSPKFHPIVGLGRGFDEYVDCSLATVSDPNLLASRRHRGSNVLKQALGDSRRGPTGERVVESFAAWLEGVDPGERFFAFVHLFDPHHDYAPPAEFDVFYEDYVGVVQDTTLELMDKRKHGLVGRDLLRIAALYDGELLYTDDNLGRLLEHLGARADETLIAVTSDHGTELLDHARLSHGKTLYEEVVRIPLVLRHPRLVPRGLVVEDVVSLTDVAPTLLELCGLRMQQEPWGRSLVPAFAGVLPSRLAPLELVSGRPDEDAARAPMVGAHGGDYKVVRDRPGVPARLFDLEGDPEERGQGSENDPRIDAARALWRELRAARQLDTDWAR